MVKDRLIFTLLYGDGAYNISRNFNLQRVGDLNWVRENYEFNSIAKSIDELMVLDVSRSGRDIENLADQIEKLAQTCFMPIAAGGGIRRVDHAYRLFKAGADKVVLNSALFSDPDLVRELSSLFGAQSIVASLDFRLGSDGARKVFAENGELDTGMSLTAALAHAASLNIGEIYLTSINNDGTGNGYDLEALRIGARSSPVPTIASGGAGNYRHLMEGLQVEGISAVSTADLFNFMGDGIQEARELIAANGFRLCMWAER